MITSDVADVMETAIHVRKPLLLYGEPGVAKTSVTKQVTGRLAHDFLVSHPGFEQPSDVQGLPWPEKGKNKATFLPMGQFAKALNVKRPTVWLLDDFGLATPLMQGAYMQLLLEREINGHRLPDCITIIVATNDRKHKAGVQGLLEPVKSRMLSMIHVEAHLPDWLDWAYGNRIDPMVIAFLQLRGLEYPFEEELPEGATEEQQIEHVKKAKEAKAKQLFCVFDPTSDMTNCPSPRTWEHVSDWLKGGLKKKHYREVFTGAVGKAAATEFVGFLEIYQDLPNVDALLLDPDHARLPTKPSSFFAVATALAARSTPKTFNSINRYAQRIHASGADEWATVVLRDSARACPAVQKTDEWAQMIRTPLGRSLAA